MIYLELDAKSEFFFFGCGLWGLVCVVFNLTRLGAIWGAWANKKQVGGGMITG